MQLQVHISLIVSHSITTLLFVININSAEAEAEPFSARLNKAK
jgi:hypothetical protein